MLALIPSPFECEIQQGNYKLTQNSKVKSDFELSLLKAPRGEDAEIVIEKNPALSQEEYTLDVHSDGIKITASTQTGAYYALQSLRQLSRIELADGETPCCSIKDKPRFQWRGLQLDESRHFFGKEEVKRYLDYMFMMKLNVFHWHLTDDQGWRIEIKKYPLLTEIGSKREETHVDGWRTTHVVKGRYEGYYTQEDIKDIVEYARQRGIMVVPEIDMPAHFAAAMAAYPWLGCREIKTEVPGYFGGRVPLSRGIRDWNRTACMGKESTFEFVFNVIDEVCALFDAPYFHIGGDEAPRNEWKKCPLCQKVIQENHLNNEDDLQGWFNNRICEYVKSKGKRLIGWNEILSAKNLDHSVVAQYWTPKRDKHAERYVNSGGNMIMSNHKSFYFDMTYAQYPLKNTYEYSPEKFGVESRNMKNVLGVEGEMWTEWIDGREKLDLNLSPRIQALSEVAWSPENKSDWNDFKARLDLFKPFYKSLGRNYAVDSVSLVKNPFDRFYIKNKFYRGDTHLEVKLNKKFIAKGEK